MTTPSSNDNRRARRVLVTLVIATGAAAVTAGVALQNHSHPEAVVQRAGSRPMLAGDTATTAPMPTRRQQWRDPWARPAPRSESAPTSIHESLDVVPPSDRSLPVAADALQRATGASAESAPTF